MLTFIAQDKGGLRVKGAERPIAVFTAKPEAGDLSLVAVPEETPSQDTISWPGEYDVAGITIRGVGQMEGQQVSYLTVADGVRCAFLSAPLTDWTDQEIESLGEVDVLALPAEDDKRVHKLVESIDPRVLILLPDAKGKMDPDVLKVCGAQGKERVSEHKVKGLPAEGREVVLLTQ